LDLLKDGHLNVNATLNHIEAHISDPGWKASYKKQFIGCQEHATKAIDKNQKNMESAPCLIKKDLCDVTFMLIVGCIDLTNFHVSRKEFDSKVI